MSVCGMSVTVSPRVLCLCVGGDAPVSFVSSQWESGRFCQGGFVRPLSPCPVCYCYSTVPGRLTFLLSLLHLHNGLKNSLRSPPAIAVKRLFCCSTPPPSHPLFVSDAPNEKRKAGLVVNHFILFSVRYLFNKTLSCFNNVALIGPLNSDATFVFLCPGLKG